MNSNYKQLLMMNGFPEKFIDYISTGFHLQFEKADNKKDIEWFKHFSKKHLEFMDCWANRTYPTFNWKCYRNWRGKDNDPCKEKAIIMKDEL